MKTFRTLAARAGIGMALAALWLLAVPAGAAAGAIAPASHSVSLHHGGGSFHGGFCYGCGWHGGWWGWGWGWGWYGYPYGPYGYSPYVYRRGYPTGWTAVKTDVEPDEAALYLDGKLIGTADDFDGFPDMLYLRRGSYKLEFRLEGFEPYTVTVDAAPGRHFRIDHRLSKVPGAKRHGTYNPARPEGGIVRYFAKKDGVAVPYVPGGRDYREHRERRGEMAPPPDGDLDADSDAGREAGASGVSASEAEQTPGEPDMPAGGATPAPDDSAGIVAASESRIIFHVEPDDAAVYVDDRFAGSARDLNALGAGLPVSPGEHRVTVTRPGYREKQAKIEVGDREKPRLDINLSR
jgi:hypothetical protein